MERAFYWKHKERKLEIHRITVDYFNGFQYYAVFSLNIQNLNHGTHEEQKQVFSLSNDNVMQITFCNSPQHTNWSYTTVPRSRGNLYLPCLTQTFVKWQWNMVTPGGKVKTEDEEWKHSVYVPHKCTLLAVRGRTLCLSREAQNCFGSQTKAEHSVFF